MSATVAAAVKAAIVILSNEEARKKVGWGIVAILSPLIVLVVLLCAILSGTSQHNVSAVELCFHGGSISASATPEYQRRSVNFIDFPQLLKPLFIGNDEWISLRKCGIVLLHGQPTGA